VPKISRSETPGNSWQNGYCELFNGELRDELPNGENLCALREAHVLTEQAIRKLMRAPWPGNARELENCVERTLALADSHEIRVSDILLSSDEGRRGDGSLKDTLV
jgi:transcriptional regulator with PAS, ATPase and Fis domain